MKYLFSFLFFVAITLNVSALSVDSLGIRDYLAINNIEAQESKEGIYYTFDKKGTGKLPKPGDYVKLKYIGKMLDGIVFDQSEEDHPFVFQVGYRIVIQGWDQGIQFLPVGSKASLFIPAELAYGRSGLGKIPSNTPLLFEIEVLDILSPAAYDRYMMEIERKERAAYERHIKDHFIKDKRALNDYAAGKKWRVKTTDSGLSYLIKKKGKGDLLKKGNKIKVHYEGFLMDGTKFDSSYDNKEPFEFVLGIGKVIDGWDEGLQFFRPGSQGWLLIPSKLAYGRMAIREEGVFVPEDSPLIFKVKVWAVD